MLALIVLMIKSGYSLDNYIYKFANNLCKFIILSLRLDMLENCKLNLQVILNKVLYCILT